MPEITSEDSFQEMATTSIQATSNQSVTIAWECVPTRHASYLDALCHLMRSFAKHLLQDDDQLRMLSSPRTQEHEVRLHNLQRLRGDLLGGNPGSLAAML